MSETKGVYKTNVYETFKDILDEFLSKTQIDRSDINMVVHLDNGVQLRMKNGDIITYIKAES